MRSITCILMLILTSQVLSQGLPSWVMRPPQPAGAFVAVGMGEGKADALARALVDISTQLEIFDQMNKPDTSLITSMVMERSFGDVSIKFLDKSYSETELVDGIESMNEYFESSTELRLDKDEHKWIAKQYLSYLNKAGQEQDKTHFEITGFNAGLNDVMAELSATGFTFKIFANQDAYYLLTIYRP